MRPIFLRSKEQEHSVHDASEGWTFCSGWGILLLGLSPSQNERSRVPERKDKMSHNIELLGFLRTCIDRRFVQGSRSAFEAKTGLGPTAYWHEAYAGGAARDPSLVENDPGTGTNIYADEYAFKHHATMFGWGAHIDDCGGLPGADATQIGQALDHHIEAMIAKYPTCTHYRLLASVSGIDITQVWPRS
jgi:hypothetical protein